MCLTLANLIDYGPTGSSSVPGKNAGAGSHFLLQGFPIQGQTWAPMAGGFSYRLSHQGSQSLSGDRDATDGLVKTRSLGQTLTQEDQVLMKRGNLDPEDDVKPWGECHMKTEDWRMRPICQGRPQKIMQASRNRDKGRLPPSRPPLSRNRVIPVDTHSICGTIL